MPLDAERSDAEGISIGRENIMFDVTPTASTGEAWSTTSRRRCCDNGLTIERESCGSLLEGRRSRWLGDRLTEEDCRVMEYQPVRNLAPAYTATDTSAVPLCKTVTVSATRKTQLPGDASAINKSKAATRAAASERHSLQESVSSDEAHCREKPRACSRDHASCDTDERVRCKGSTLELNKQSSTTNKFHFTTTVKAGSIPGHTRNRQIDLKRQARAMIYRRPGTPQLPLAVDEQTHHHHASNRCHSATRNRMAEARIFSRLISGGTDGSISRNNSNCAKGEMSAAGCVALFVIAITAFAAGTVCGPPLGEQQALPIATPRTYTKSDDNYVLNNRAPNTHISREHSFRWRRSLPGATALMPAWYKKSQDSSEYITLPAAEVMNKKPKSSPLSRCHRGRGKRGTRLVKNTYSSNNRAHVALSVFSRQRDNCEHQQQATGYFLQEQDQDDQCHAWMPPAILCPTTAVLSVDQVMPALQAPSFPGDVDLQEGRKEGALHEVFQRVRMPSGS
ncbi:unnamed protein product, partial [Sphacelaria rigidula]